MNTDLISHLMNGGARPAVIDLRSGRSYSYAELGDLATRAAGALQALGCAEGDRVILRLPNSIENLALILGCVHAGVDCAPLSMRASEQDAAHWARTTGARHAFLSQFQHDAAAARLSSLCNVTTIATNGDFEWMKDASSASASARGSRLCIATSGSTGPAKGVAHRFETLRAGARAFAAAHEFIDQDARFFSEFPMSTLGGVFNVGVLPLEIGASIVIGDAPDQSVLKFWHDVARSGANVLWLTPSRLRFLLRPGSVESIHKAAKGVRAAFLGTAPITLADKIAFEDAYGLPVIENYGLTETLFATTETWGGRFRRSEASVGLPVDGVEISFRAAEGAPLIAPKSEQAAEPWEIMVKTPFFFEGYLYGPDEIVPPKLDAEGFLATGDLGRLDGHGQLQVDGRLKSIVKRAGFLVSLPEVESALRELDALADVAAAPMAHRYFGESYAVFVVGARPEADAAKLVERVRFHIASRLSRENWPDDVLVIDEIPYLATGKVDYQALAQRLEEATGRL